MTLPINKIVLFLILPLFFSYGIAYYPRVEWSVWKQLGLINQNILSILYSKKTSKLVCGTYSGVYILDIPTGSSITIPGVSGYVTDITESVDGDIYLIAGQSPVSGGAIYFCKLVEPSIPKYTCKKIEGSFATCLAVKTHGNDTLYCGGMHDSIVGYAKNDSDTFINIGTIPAPENCFVTCTDLHIDPSTQSLIAGGYGRVNPNVPAPGKFGSLLEKKNDSMVTIIEKINVTSLTECRYYRQTVYPLPLISTVDTGIFYAEDYSKKQWYNSRWKNELRDPVLKINSLLITLPMHTANSGYRYQSASVTLMVCKSGVYEGWIGSHTGNQCVKFGIDASAIPSCLAAVSKDTIYNYRFDLYVGTSKGVYGTHGECYGLPVVDHESNAPHKTPLFGYCMSGKSLVITFFSGSGDDTRVEIFSSSGRNIFSSGQTRYGKGTNKIAIGDFMIHNAAGIYYCKIINGANGTTHKIIVH